MTMRAPRPERMTVSTIASGATLARSLTSSAMHVASARRGRRPTPNVPSASVAGPGGTHWAVATARRSKSVSRAPRVRFRLTVARSRTATSVRHLVQPVARAQPRAMHVAWTISSRRVNGTQRIPKRSYTPSLEEKAKTRGWSTLTLAYRTLTSCFTAASSRMHAVSAPTSSTAIESGLRRKRWISTGRRGTGATRQAACRSYAVSIPSSVMPILLRAPSPSPTQRIVTTLSPTRRTTPRRTRRTRRMRPAQQNRQQTPRRTPPPRTAATTTMARSATSARRRCSGTRLRKSASTATGTARSVGSPSSSSSSSSSPPPSL
mmetsp:Transcript_81247/g.230603  ORF Transcript_81247/g.230603 Transcript_81247/m.230603 type:complete len:320 (+) Transcript_81247:2202-3161(+)